jgi:hypothetical protein
MLTLKFKNTQGSGPTRAFLESACNIFSKRLDNIDSGLYILYYSQVTPSDITFMNQLGLLFSQALHYDINLPLARPFYEALINLEHYFNNVTIEYFLPELTIKHIRSDNVESLDLTMTVRAADTDGNIRDFDLVENGGNISVGAHNVDTYIALVDDFYKRRGGRDVLMNAFCAGFGLYGKIDKFGGHINYTELKAMLTTPYKITKEMYTSNLYYYYYCGKHSTWLKEYVANLPDAKFDKFLEFVCGTSIINKNTLYTFGGNCRFSVNLYNITKNPYGYYDSKHMFTVPYTTTCSKQINIPRCTDQTEFNTKMDLAMDNYMLCDDFQLE